MLDVDVSAGKGGAESLAKLEGEHGSLDRRARQQSGSGGSHYDFAEVEGIKRSLGFRPGLDLLTGPGCYIVAEPSLHLSGGHYLWADEINPLVERRDKISLAVPPAWLLDAASKPKTNATTATANSAGERVPVERMLSLAVDKIKTGESRNAAGFWFFCQLRDAGYDRTEASLTVHEWVEKANGAAPTNHRYTKTEADATLRSVFKREVRAPSGAKKEKENPAEILLKLIPDFEYFKSGPANDAYVRMEIGDHKEVWKVDPKSPKVREVPTHRFLTQSALAPSREALNLVLDTVLAQCSMGPKVDVNVRFARSRDRIFLDLCDDQWRAIEITKEGWNVVDNPPVLFRRYSGALPLPLPTKGGSIESLRPLLNASDDAQWLLMIAWLMGVFLPEGAFSHLVFQGEQGSAKSSTANILLSLLDPSVAGLCGAPKDETDATVSALNAGILGYDNMSGCRADISDVFCRFSTGQGYKTRTFYENLGITVASVKVPVLLNGIDATVMRGDLLERSIILKLPRIIPENRRTEQGISADFALLHPACLGALLDAVSVGLANLPNTELTHAPRMADFCTWVTACEPALPWEPGQFLAAYEARLAEANKDLAEDDSLACALMDWANHNLCSGTPTVISAKDLLAGLNAERLGSPKDLRYWPASEGSLSHKLLRLAAVLRAQGIDMRKLPRTTAIRSRWEISRTGPLGLLVPRFIDQHGVKLVA